MYKAVTSKSQLKFGQGSNIAIVTGWSALSYIKTIPENLYAVAGNLYSANRGIEILFINLLNNPQINKIIALNRTIADRNSKSIETLKKIFEKSLCFEDLGFTTNVLNLSHIDLLVSSIEFKEVATIEELEQECRTTSNSSSKRKRIKLEPAFENVIKSDSIQTNVLTSFNYKFAESWLRLLKTVVKHGSLAESSYGKTLNLPGVSLRVDETFKELTENLDLYGLSEEFLEEYLKQYLEEESTDHKLAAYSYSSRMNNVEGGSQVKKVIKALLKNLETRRAVISFWDLNKDLASDHPPCLISLQFSVNESELNCFATFRSSEVFSALPANILGIRRLHEKIFEEMVLIRANVKLGFLLISISSAHINIGSAEQAINKTENLKKFKKFTDPTGRYIIYLNNNNLNVEWWNNRNDSLKVFSTKAEFLKIGSLMRKIQDENPGIDVEHYGYVYEECIKACECLKNSKKYVQL